MAEPGQKATNGQPAMGIDGDGNLQFLQAVPAASIGTPADTEWDGVSANPTLFAILKKIANNPGP